VATMQDAVSPEQVKNLIHGSEELSLLDVREEGEFSQGHLLYASSLPLSRLELAADALVPRRATRIVVLDGDGGSLAARAARRLGELGWTDVAIMRGGIAAWRDSGYEIFTGVNVPSKAFGEFVEHEYGTPHIEASELKRRIDAGEKILILDSRTADEFEAMSIPGALSCPGAELVYRAPALVDSPRMLVVVNCAGRTRSIIGAQSLINAGIDNPVVALKNGTMGWHLAGLELAHGATAAAPPPSPEGLSRARAAAARVAQRFGVRRIDAQELLRLEEGADSHCLYRLDVRTPQEYRAGHLEGWRSAPGGQLVQATDRYVGTLHSRIVVGDDDGVRAVLTASWLVQMGWENVFAIELDLVGRKLETGPEPQRILGETGSVEIVDALALRQMLEHGTAVVIDLANSLEFRNSHIQGAWWAIRARLSDALARLPRTGTVVFTSADGMLARLAAADLRDTPGLRAMALAGGTAAWRDAGLPMAAGTDRMADEPVDVWYRPYDRSDQVEAAMRSYLTWEVDLPRQIERDGDARFRLFR